MPVITLAYANYVMGPPQMISSSSDLSHPLIFYVHFMVFAFYMLGSDMVVFFINRAPVFAFHRYNPSEHTHDRHKCLLVLDPDHTGVY